VEHAVEVTVAEADVDVVSGRLWGAGATAIAEHPAPDGHVVLVAGGPPESLLAAVSSWPATVVEVDAGAAVDAWRPHARPIRAGTRILLEPPWRAGSPSDDPPDDPIVVRLDARRAFGSGSHPSTRLAIAAIEQHVAQGSRVLDVGCGSGVLSVVAALLGASAVVGIDIDDEAVAATLANAAVNDVADVVTASTSPTHVVAGEHEPFDVVVANMLAVTLIAEADALRAAVADGGVLIMSGLLSSQADDVTEAIGLELVERSSDADWASLVLRR
jgi:ribosomal protein L11 methyltransferase